MRTIYKILLSLLTGLLLSAAWPTNGFTPLIFIAFVPLLYLHDRSCEDKRSNVFAFSFLSFLVWNSLTTWWVWNSTPAGSIAMLLLNSSFMAATFWLYHIARKKIFHNKNGYFLLIIFFLAFENLHLNWQLNWPWLNIGNVFSHNHTWIQWYEYTGIAGGTVWVLLANILAYKILNSVIILRAQQTEVKDQRLLSVSSIIRSNCFRYIVVFLAVIFIPIMISKIMYNSYEENGDEVEVVVVQPNIDPYNEEFTLSSREILTRNFDRAEPLMTKNTRFVVSPESSIHENIWLDKLEHYYSIKNLRLFSKNYNSAAYVIGASTLGMVPEGEEDDFAARKFYDVDEYYYCYNTAFLVTDTSDIQWHHKSRLTPGVEMMPSWWFLGPLRNLAIDLGGTTGTLKSEDEVSVLNYENYKIAPLICYESVFGGYVTEFIRKGANIIFVITNDGWWGDTPGHRQHFEMSKLRAIENRRSIARSANTGISGFINQKGDVIEKTNYWEPTALRNSLYTNDEITFYSKHGDYLYRIASFVAVMVICFTVVLSIIRKR